MSSTFLSSSDKFINVTPSDTVPLTYQGTVMKCRGISVGTAGTLALKDSEGTAVTLPSNAIAIGVIHPCSSDYVMATNTTASEIIAWF